MAIDSGTGKIIVAGTASVYDFALARLNENGSFDTTFDTDGKVTTDFGSVSGTGPYDSTYSIVLSGDGRVTAAGVTREPDSTNDNFALARYLPSGGLDTSFDTDGMLVTDFGSTRSDTGYSIAITPGGRAGNKGDANL